MNKSILVAGITGSGKSSVCGELKKLGYKAYDIESMDGLFAWVDKATGKIVDDQDNDNLESVKQHDWLCDKNKLQDIVRKNSVGIVFYCGTASNLDELLPLFDKIFILIATPKTLLERLTKRKANGFAHNSKVQEWILSWKEWWEDHMREKDAIIIDANRDVKEIAADIVERTKAF